MYDIFGLLIEEEVEIGCSTTVTRYAYDGWNPAKLGATGTAGYDVWAVFNSMGSLTSRQLQGDGIDQHLAYVQGGTALWYLTDHLGSARATINNSGTVQDSLTYDAFGNLTDSTPTARPLYTYTGRELDVETGLQYNRARWYDPNTGRWISQDPMGFDAGDSNLYRYVNNAPTDATDPSGLLEAVGGNDAGTAKGGEATQGTVKGGIGMGIAKSTKGIGGAAKDTDYLVQLENALTPSIAGKTGRWAVPLAFRLNKASDSVSGGVILGHSAGATFQATTKAGKIDLNKNYITSFWWILPVGPEKIAPAQNKMSDQQAKLFGAKAGTPYNLLYFSTPLQDYLSTYSSSSIEVYYVNKVTVNNVLFAGFKKNTTGKFLADPQMLVNKDFDLADITKKKLTVSSGLSIKVQAKWEKGKEPEITFPD